jgi:hypothetical protein
MKVNEPASLAKRTSETASIGVVRQYFEKNVVNGLVNGKNLNGSLQLLLVAQS